MTDDIVFVCVVLALSACGMVAAYLAGRCKQARIDAEWHRMNIVANLRRPLRRFYDPSEWND